LIAPRSGALRRPAAAPSLRPRDGGRDLPPWPLPHPPRSGWTTEAAFEAALDYASLHAGRPDLPPERRLVQIAYQLLLVELGLHRLSVRERLSGVDRVDDYLGRTPAHDGPLDEDDEDDAPPF
jgi:hypothetical protein